MTLKVLVVEDTVELQRVIERRLRARGAEVVSTDTVATAVEILTNDPGFHVVLVDVHLPDGSGLDVLGRLPAHVRKPVAIVMTGDGSLENAVGAMHAGATDFILKPFSPEALDTALARALAGQSVASRVAESTAPDATEQWRRRYAPTMRGESPELTRAFDRMRRVADTDCAVLIQGETGTGKELVARAVHEASNVKNGPFVAINCAAVPATLLESELFGHARGAFTGAHTARQGRVAAAEHGTLFLDVVGELPLALQVKLLRLLQQREYSPVGDTRTYKADIRIVAATNRDLMKEVAAGRFREDLFYRLNVIHLDLPPLRDRAEDVELLAAHFFREHAARAGRDDLTGLAPETLTALRAHTWPGNIRALENVVERAVLLSHGPQITVADLPPEVRGATASNAKAAPSLPDVGIDLRTAVEQFENQLILQALDRTGWNKQRAAALLRVNRTTLIEMVKRKNLCA